MINNTNIVMGIETSCDETSIAILEGENKLLSNIISSQMEIHEKYGGIVRKCFQKTYGAYYDYLQGSLRTGKY